MKRRERIGAALLAIPATGCDSIWRRLHGGQAEGMRWKRYDGKEPVDAALLAIPASQPHRGAGGL